MEPRQAEHRYEIPATGLTLVCNTPLENLGKWKAGKDVSATVTIENTGGTALSRSHYEALAQSLDTALNPESATFRFAVSVPEKEKTLSVQVEYPERIVRDDRIFTNLETRLFEGLGAVGSDPHHPMIFSVMR